MRDRLDEAADAIHEQPAHASAVHGVEQPVSELVQDAFGRPLPDDLGMALLDRSSEAQIKVARLLD